jgi:hypothetical protein
VVSVAMRALLRAETSNATLAREVQAIERTPRML